MLRVCDKFGGDVMKYYGPQFFRDFKGVTEETKHHVLYVEKIKKGQLFGCHDEATFLKELQGKGKIISQRVHPKYPDVIHYEYKLYQKDKAAMLVDPPVLSNRPPFEKTTIRNLDKNWEIWKYTVNQTADSAILKKQFPLKEGWFTEQVNDILIVSSFRNNQIATFFIDW